MSDDQNVDNSSGGRFGVPAREKSGWLLLALTSIGDGVITRGADGRVKYLNTVAEALTGWNLVDAVGREVEQVFHVVDEMTAQPVRLPATAAMTRGPSGELGGHVLLVARDGTRKPIEARFATIDDEHGRGLDVVFIVRDITQRRQSEKAERERDQFFGTIPTDGKQKADFLVKLSHELRNPLAAIHNTITVMALTDDTGYRDYSIDVIQRQTRYMSRIIENVVGISRTNFGKTEIADRPSAPNNPAMPATTRPRAAGRTLRVLIVDDNIDTATGMAMLFKMTGHDVVTVHTGADAIGAARGHRPELIILDIGLPAMDGHQVARRLRQDGFRDALIVAISGYGQDEDRLRSQEAGFDHHLVKPVDFNDLLVLINQLVEPDVG